MPYMKSHSLVGGERLGAAAGDDRGRDPLGVGRLDGVERGFAQAPVDPQARARAHLDVDVGRAVFHGEAQQSVQVQHDASEPVYRPPARRSEGPSCAPGTRHRVPGSIYAPAMTATSALPRSRRRSGSCSGRPATSVGGRSSPPWPTPGSSSSGATRGAPRRSGATWASCAASSRSGSRHRRRRRAARARSPTASSTTPSGPTSTSWSASSKPGVNVVSTAAFITGHALGDGRDRVVDACEHGRHARSSAAGMNPGLRQPARHRVGRDLRPHRLHLGARVGRLDRLRLPRHRAVGRVRATDRRPRAARRWCDAAPRCSATRCC